MDTTINQQVALDEALVPHAKRLRIGRSNFRMLSNIKSKKSTFQLVYHVLRLYPFFKAFLVTADVPQIYMQEFWATATVHHHAIRFKMDNKKHIVNLESLRDMLHICPRVPSQSFAEPPFEEEILAFICFLGHSAAIKKLTDVEQKESKKSNEMYYPRFTKVIIHHFMSKDPSIPRRNKVNWHSVRDDHMFSTIKLVPRHQNTQQFGALLPIELTNEEIRNSNAYKEYYVIATGVAPPKPKACVRKTRSSFDTTITPLTVVVGPRLTTSNKGKQTATASKAKSLYVLSEVAMIEVKQLKLVTKRSLKQTHISQVSSFGSNEGTGKDGDGDDDDNGDDGEEGYGDNDDEDDDGEEGDDDGDDDQEVEKDDEKDDKEEGNGEEDLGLNVGREEGHDEEEEEDELYKDVNINQGRGIQVTLEVEDSHVTLTPVNPDGNKSIQCFDEQRNLYKALVEASESDKIILDTYEETITLKRRRDDDADKDEEPSARPDWGSKRCREGKEPESASAPMKTATRSTGGSTQGYQSRQTSTSESAFVEDPMQTTFQMEEPSHLEFDTGAEDQPIVQSSQHPKWFSQQQKPPSLDRDWNKTVVIPFEHFINNDLEYLRGGTSSHKYTTSITKTKAEDYGHIKWIEDLVPRTMWIGEPIGYEKHASGESPIGDVNVSSSTVLLLTGSLLAMCILSEESSLSLNSRL
nr:hypothetical protein [Tanacetum cinerariifolium]